MTHQKLDTYLDLCTQVYDLSKPRPPEDAYAFYRSYAVSANGPILEPMCGTGRFLLPLLEEGLNVQGFDASDHMLGTLNTKAKAKNLKPRVWQAFAEELVREEQYQLIFIPSGSFGLITEPAKARAAIKVMYDHLVEDGILLLEVETLNAVPKEVGVWRGSAWRRPDGKMIILSQLATLKGDLCFSIGRYELVDANKIIHTEIEELRVRLYDDPAFLLEMLKEVGFKDVRAVKAFDRAQSPHPGDEAVVYECQK